MGSRVRDPATDLSPLLVCKRRKNEFCSLAVMEPHPATTSRPAPLPTWYEGPTAGARNNGHQDALHQLLQQGPWRQRHCARLRAQHSWQDERDREDANHVAAEGEEQRQCRVAAHSLQESRHSMHSTRFTPMSVQVAQVGK